MPPEAITTETQLANYRLKSDADLPGMRTAVRSWLSNEFPGQDILEQLCYPQPVETLDDCVDIDSRLQNYEGILRALSELRKAAGPLSRKLLNDMQNGLALTIAVNTKKTALGVLFTLTTGSIEEADIPEEKMGGLLQVLNPYIARVTSKP